MALIERLKKLLKYVLSGTAFLHETKILLNSFIREFSYSAGTGGKF